MFRTMSPSGHLAAQARGARQSAASLTCGTALFVHPGTAGAPRVLDAATQALTREFSVTLPAGTRVGPALRRLLDGWHAGAGCGRIVGGTCAKIQYHVMEHATEGSRPYVYGPPIACNGESTVIGAAITVGHRADGTRILHCHGGFVDADGEHHGGHVILDETVVSGGGLQVRLCVFDDIDLVVSPDAETHFDLLQPVRRS